MRLIPRLVDALRSPARFGGFVRRFAELARRGELGATLARLRARSFDDDDYRRWLARSRRAPERGDVCTKFALLLDAASPGELMSMREGCGSGVPPPVAVLVREDVGDRWTRAGESVSRVLAEHVALLEAEWLLWIAAPATLDADALATLAQACSRGEVRLVYGDHDHVDARGRPSRPSFKPAWDAWQILETNYPGPVLAVHRSLVKWLAGPRRPGSAGPWRAMLEASAALPEGAVVHMPHIVAHVPCASSADETVERVAVLDALESASRRRGLSLRADARTRPWLCYATPGDASVSIVVPTRDRARLLERCLAAVVATRGRHDVEIVVVDNGSTQGEVRDVLARTRRSIRLAVVERAEPFNFPRLCNAGVAVARGRVVVLLNNDTVPDDGWLDELVPLALQPGVGAVGPLLLYPDGRAQSAGVLVGVNRTATSALAGFAPEDPAAIAWCASRRRVSAVLGACIAIDRATWLRVGGMDERFAVSHNEVDLGLRLEAAGLANIFTPFARVVHDEGGTRGFEVTAAERERLAGEERAFRGRWGEALARCDPAYHPCLARNGVPFTLAPDASPVAPRAGWRAPPLRLADQADAQHQLECAPPGPAEGTSPAGRRSASPP